MANDMNRWIKSLLIYLVSFGLLICVIACFFALSSYLQGITDVRRAAEHGDVNLDLMLYRTVALPPEIFDLTSLKTLNLTNNWLLYLSPEISRLDDLTGLNLGSNVLACRQKSVDYLISNIWA